MAQVWKAWRSQSRVDSTRGPESGHLGDRVSLLFRPTAAAQVLGPGARGPHVPWHSWEHSPVVCSRGPCGSGGRGPLCSRQPSVFGSHGDTFCVYPTIIWRHRLRRPNIPPSPQEVPTRSGSVCRDRGGLGDHARLGLQAGSRPLCLPQAGLGRAAVRQARAPRPLWRGPTAGRWLPGRGLLRVRARELVTDGWNDQGHAGVLAWAGTHGPATSAPRPAAADARACVTGSQCTCDAAVVS